MTSPGIEEVIAAKRDGRAHSREQLDRLVLGFVSGDVPDYQMSAWLMAALLNGLTMAETVLLTDAMVRSGEVIDLSCVPGRKVDKHSTGGVADTTTLVVAPLVAACGVPVAKMSGRGLGHTGGTLDKLEAIPGFVVDLGPERFAQQVRDVGVAVISQSESVDPADKLMYALRDVTATVPSIPLIVSSIISKKVAGGADAILLDVKAGSGAFMKTVAQAEELAIALTSVGRELGRDVECVVTSMDQPLGTAVGNALEVEEAIATLRGRGPADLTELCSEFAARMVVLGEGARDAATARERVSTALASGAAAEKFREWIAAQGGDARIVDDPGLLPRCAHTRPVLAQASGWVAGFDAEEVGRAAMLAGAGRARAGDPIDPGAGLSGCVRVGERVEVGDELCRIHVSDPDLFDVVEERFRRAVRIGHEPPPTRPLFQEASA